MTEDRQKQRAGRRDGQKHGDAEAVYPGPHMIVPRPGDVFRLLPPVATLLVLQLLGVLRRG